MIIYLMASLWQLRALMAIYSAVGLLYHKVNHFLHFEACTIVNEVSVSLHSCCMDAENLLNSCKGIVFVIVAIQLRCGDIPLQL